MEPSLGPLNNALANWQNKDLLIAPETRAALTIEDRRFASILVWPELRTLFLEKDAIANRYRRKVRHSSIAAIAFAFIGLAVAQLRDVGTGYLPDIIAISFTLIATALTVVMLLLAQSRSRWLFGRMWTERLRQLYFQFFLRHLPLIHEVFCDAGNPAAPSDAAERLRVERENVLMRFRLAMEGDEAHLFNRIIDDRAEIDPWILEDLGQTPELPAMDAELEILFELLRRQRIDVQLEYSKRKTQRGFGSPVSQQSYVSATGSIFTVLAVLLGVVSIATWLVDGNEWLFPLLVCQGFATAIVVFANGLDHGLGISADAKRYEWYIASLEHFRTGFRNAVTASEKSEILRQVELCTYQEMRRFLVSHRSPFSII